MATFSESSAADWDSSQAEQGIRHFDDANVDNTDSGKLRKGFKKADEGDSSLEAYYAFDEDSGSTANDITGNGHDGTHVDTVTVGATGLLNTNCYSFGGTGAVNCGSFSTSSIFDNSDFSIVSFVKFDTLSDGTQIVVSYKGSGSAFAQIAHNEFNDFRASFDDGSSNNRARIDSAFANTNTWYCYAATHDEGTGYTAYIIEPDGTLHSASTSENGSLEASGNDLRIGSSQFTSERLNGDIDEVRIYGRTLSQSEIVAIADTAFGESEYWADKKTT